MAEKAESLGSASRARLITGGQSRSFSDTNVAAEESRGCLPSLRHDLNPASITPLRAPSTVVARPPQLDFGQITRPLSSNAVFGGDRLRPLTPIHHPKSPSRAADMFTTSPASSDLGSPCLPNIRSSTSNISLNNSRGCRPETPTANRGLGARPSSLPRRSPQSRKSSSNPGTPHSHGKPSVKHLTCFWWKEKGDCRFKEEDCLYAHHDTGLYADPPRQVIPGEPAMAGRSLDRALRKLHSDHHNSSSSLKSMSSEINHADTASRPGTPGTEPPTSPGVTDQFKSDNAFLRNLVEQNTKEKAALIKTIDSLQAENKAIKEENVSLKAKKDQLMAERDLLRATLSKLHINQRQTPSSNPFGPIGSNPGLPAFRKITATNDNSMKDFSVQCLTESENQSPQVESMLRHLGGSF